MKNISILVPESAVLAAIDDPRHVFSMVNSFYETEKKPPVFNIKLVGLTEGNKTARQFIFRSHRSAFG